MAPMESVAAEFKSKPVRFLIIYTREAHPGQYNFKHIPQHCNIEDKSKMAAMLQQETGLENRTILIDGINDSVTRTYRGFPNKAYIIGLNGKIVFADRWASADRIRKEVHNLLKHISDFGKG
jgi:hypothetical protein